LGDDRLKAWLEGIGQHKIYRPSERIFQKELQLHVMVECGLLEFHQDINVTAGIFSLMKHRSEKADSFHGELFSDFFSMLSQKREDVLFLFHG
jgi:hypothetical protein